jgi:hypothetical protein
MEKKVTLRLDSELLRGARLLAARRGLSLSRLVTDRLEVLVREERDYEEARDRALLLLEEGFDLRWTPPDVRAELHER